MPFDANGNATVNGQKAVSGQTVMADQLNVPVADIQSMLSQLLLRSGVAPMLGPLNMNGYRITNLPDASNGSDPATFAQMSAAVGAIAAVPTGTVQAFRRKTAPDGWVKENGGTIGNASSGATTRANSDTAALFSLLWSEFSNAELPIQDATGEPTARGATAAADYAANKRMPLFDSRSRFLRGADDGLGFNTTIVVGTAQNDAIKAHSHTGTTDAAEPANPEVRVNASATAVTTSVATTLMLLSTTLGNWFSQTMRNLSHAHTFTTNATGDEETRPRCSAVLYCIKL